MYEHRLLNIQLSAARNENVKNPMWKKYDLFPKHEYTDEAH
jgi:hypothetical protein